MCLRRVYIQVLLDGVFFICLLGPFGLKYSSKSNVFFLIFRLNDLSIVESRVLKSSTIITLMSITPLRSVSIYLMYLLLPVKRLPTMLETRVRSLSWEDPLEKEMATRSSTLAWKIPWTEECSRLQSMGSQRVGHDTTEQLHSLHSLT